MSDEKKIESKKAVAPKRTVEEWAAEKSVPKWAFNGARAARKWPINAEVSESDFDNAIDSTMNDRIG